MATSWPAEGAAWPRALALAVRFLLEVALLFATASLAWHISEGFWRWPAAIIAVLAVATLWGLCLSPKAKYPLAAPVALALESALFLGIGAGLVLIGFVVPAVIGVLLWAIDRFALRILP